MFEAGLPGSMKFGAGAAAIAAVLVAAGAHVRAQAVVTVDVFASELNDPRGLAFGPDNALYVAEAGRGGGTLSTVGLCPQVQPPLGPYTGGASGRIVRFDPDRNASVVQDGLPSTEAQAAVGGDRQGVAALTFVGNHLLALISGAGCSHGHLDADNGIVAVQPGGVTRLADLSAWLLANPGAKGAEVPRNADYEPDGTWYPLAFDQGRLYTIEPNHGVLISVQPENGTVELVNQLYTTFGDHTYTSMAFDRGDLYIGTLGRIVAGPAGVDLEHSFEAGIYRLSRNGEATQVADGLHAVLGLAFDRQHRLYVLQSPIFVPGTGSLVRIDPSGQRETLMTDLTFPSAIAFGPDDALYMSECGYHCDPGQGRILRITLH